MKKTKEIIFLIMALACVVSAKGQCDMLIDFSARDYPSTAHATLKMIRPDGKSDILFDDSVKQMQKTFHLEQLGEYRLTAVFSSTLSGRDSLERRFTLSGEEYKVETIAHFQRDLKKWSDWNSKDSISSGRFSITKYSHPSPLVKIKYLRSNEGKDGEFPGPIFIIKNESRDTLYGAWLPGYFWGTVSIWKDGKYVGNRGGQICTTWNAEPPLYPDSVKYAWVGSFGIKVAPGRYRFNVYYSTENCTLNSTPLFHETDSFRWWSDVQNWHLLACEFEIKSSVPSKPSEP